MNFRFTFQTIIFTSIAAVSQLSLASAPLNDNNFPASYLRVVHGNNNASASYSIKFGYGTFDINFNASAPITKVEFDYGRPDLALNSWGGVNSSNANVTEKDLQNGLFHYLITPKGVKDFTNSASIMQIAFIPQSIPVKNMPFSNYSGLFQNLTINNQAAQLADKCTGAACQNPAPNKILGGYYADWTVYGGHGNYKPTELPFGNINTLYYAFGGLDPSTGQALMFDPYADAMMSGVNPIPYLSLMRQKYPYLNLIYSFGGWGSIKYDNFQSGDFSVLFTYYPQNIAPMAQSMVAAMLKAGFNGIDIDYEWIGPFESNTAVLGGNAPLCSPSTSDPQYCVTQPFTQQEADGYITLLYYLKQDLNKLPNSKQYLLTSTIFSGVDKINSLASFTYQGPVPALKGQSDLKLMLNTVNYVGLMTYDMHGAFDASPADNPNPDSISNFHSRFQASPLDPTVNPNIKKYNVKDAVTALLSATKNPQLSNKIVVGVPAYTRLERLANQPVNPTPSQQVGIFDPLASLEQQAILNTDVAGEFEGDYLYQYKTGGGAVEVGSTMVDYKCILQFPQDANSPDCHYSGFSGSHPLPSDMILHSMDKLPDISQPGGYAATPWGYGATSRTFMSFDNNLSAANKTKYVLSNNLGGIMVWELDGDVAPTSSQYTTKSLIYTICSIFSQGNCLSVNIAK